MHDWLVHALCFIHMQWFVLLNFLYCQIVSRYLSEGFSFLLQAFNSPTFLEEVAGLSQLHAEAVEDEVCHCLSFV